MQLKGLLHQLRTKLNWTKILLSPVYLKLKSQKKYVKKYMQEIIFNLNPA